MRSVVRGAVACVFAGLVGSAAVAQPPAREPLPMPPVPGDSAPANSESLTPNASTDAVPPAPAGEQEAVLPNGKKVVMRGRPIPIGQEWVVNQNSIERYALPEGYKGFYETPYSTRQEVADIRLVPPAPGTGLANTVILETQDLLGTAEIVLPVVFANGDRKEERIELLVIDQVSNAYRLYLQNQIKKMFPTSVVEVLILNSQTAVLKGYVERAEQVTPIENLVRGFLAAGVGAAPDSVTVVNTLRVVGAMEVQLRVMICEVQRSKMSELGFDWDWTNPSLNPPWLRAISNSTGAFGNRLAAAAIAGGAPLSSSGQGVSNLNFVLSKNGQPMFLGFVRALVTNNLAKILAEPNLVTLSGQPAYFNVGGQVPVLTPQGNSTIGIQYRDFGTNLRFVPTVLGDGRIRLEVRPEVSDLNWSNGVEVNNIKVPGFDVRVAETTVEMDAGQSFVVAGLISKRVTAATSKLPFLGDLPVAGALFQNKNYKISETEVLIMVTPYLVDALDQAPCELPGRESRDPNDIEFYLGSKFEPPCFGDPYRGHIKAWRNNIPSPQPIPVPPYDRGLSHSVDGIPLDQTIANYPSDAASLTPIEESQPEIPSEMPPRKPSESAPAGSQFTPPTVDPLPRTVPPPTTSKLPSGPMSYEVSYGNRGSTTVPEFPAVNELTLVPSPPPKTPEEDAAAAKSEFTPPRPQAWRKGNTGRWK